VNDSPRPPDPPAWLLLAAFTLAALGLAFPDITRLHSSVAGNSGDSLLNLWIMRRVQIGLPHGWHAFWDAPIFHPALNTLGYSETLLPEALLHWILRPVLGDALAFNVIYLGAWVVCSWCTYRLARRVVEHWGAAFVAALAFTYSSVRLVHHGHFQLVVGGALVPLVLLLLLRLLEAPANRRGIALGVAFSVTALTASYYGAMMAVVVAVVVAGWFATQRRWPARASLVALGLAAAVVFVLVAPISLQYVRIQRDPIFRHAFDPTMAARLGDFLAAGSPNHLLHWFPVLGSASSPTRDLEHRLFPGLVALALGAFGVLVIAREVRARGARVGRARELVILGGTGVLVTTFAFGDWFRIDGRRVWLPFALLRHGVPGFAGIRAVSRFAILGELALALFAAVGFDRISQRVRPARGAPLTGALVVLVVIESAIGIQFVRVPTSRDDGGVDIALRRAPRGVVLELPILSAVSGGPEWAFVETPRQLAAIRDGDPRVNGYSGFQPAGFDERARVLNHFPGPVALAQARALGVRYVILRTKLVGTITPRSYTRELDADRVGRFTDATARRMLKSIPPGATTGVEKLPGGYLVKLR
jgi:hypothetical protein